MIQSKEDYRFFLEADRIALHSCIRAPYPKQPRMFQDEIWKFQRLLRKVEYLQNCGQNRFNQIAFLWARFNLRKLSLQLGFAIPPNVFGPGLSIAHRGPIVVDPAVKVGDNCRIHQCVTIGTIPPNPLVPTIGNNVFIGTGAVIVGGIEIADGIAIGANSYVAKSFKEPNITIAGSPAKKVSNKGSKCLWPRATEILQGQK